jgi:biopolymer transport protein ExbD
MHDGFAPAPRRRALSMTSLINIIFLLLPFFTLSTSFAQHGEIVVQEGGSGPAPRRRHVSCG